MFAKLAITVWLLAIALWDLRAGLIPNALTLPVLFGAGGYRLAQLLSAFTGERWRCSLGLDAWEASPALGALLAEPANRSFLWIAWLVVFGLWAANVMRGGDAKLLMGLLALFPTLHFAFLYACLVLLLSLPVAAVTYRGVKVGDLLRSAAARLLSGRVWPTAEELEKRGKPMAWLFCLAGALYVWLAW